MLNRHDEREHPAGLQLNDKWKDKLIVIGSTATGNDLSDVGPSPLGSETHLVTKHLNVANSIIADRFVTTSPLWLRFLMIVLMGAGGGMDQSRPNPAAARERR